MIRIDKKKWDEMNLIEFRAIFSCKCGCGFNAVDVQIFNLLKALMERGFVIYILSGNRCVKHNTNVRGVKNSLHTKGRAIDLVLCKIVGGEEVLADQFEFSNRIQEIYKNIEIGLYDKGRIHLGFGKKGFWDHRT